LNVKAQHAIKSHFDISVKGTLIFFYIQKQIKSKLCVAKYFWIIYVFNYGNI